MDILYKKRAQSQLGTPNIQLVFSSARAKAQGDDRWQPPPGCPILTAFT